MRINQKSNYEIFCEYRGHELSKLKETAERAKYEHNCNVKLGNKRITVTAKMPLDCDEVVKYQVEYSNNTTQDLDKVLKLVDEYYRNIFKPYFLSLILIVKCKLYGCELQCRDHDVLLKIPHRESTSFKYNGDEFERCVETIGALIIAASFGKNPTKICEAKAGRTRANWRGCKKNKRHQKAQLKDRRKK